MKSNNMCILELVGSKFLSVLGEKSFLVRLPFGQVFGLNLVTLGFTFLVDPLLQLSVLVRLELEALVELAAAVDTLGRSSIPGLILGQGLT
jgi:hypothetical protein